jgi:hypothetical protein
MRFSAKKAKWEQVHDRELPTWDNFNLQDSELKLTNDLHLKVTPFELEIMWDAYLYFKETFNIVLGMLI